MARKGGNGARMRPCQFGLGEWVVVENLRGLIRLRCVWNQTVLRFD
jgi:hypothetical protein